MEYKEIKKWLDENNLTHEEMNKIWEKVKPDNWKLKALERAGKTWYDLNESALHSLLRLYILSQ